MKKHFLYIDLGYWLITKIEKTVIEEDKLENYIEVKREICMCDMRAREENLLDLLENDYNQKKIVITANKVWEALEAIYEGDKNVKRIT